MLGLLMLQRRGPRIVTASKFVAQHFEYYASDENSHLDPACWDAPVLLLDVWFFFVFLVFCALDILLWRFDYRNGLRMGKYALLHLKFYPCSPALLFGCHRPPFYPYPYDGEAKRKIGWGPRGICPEYRDDLVENASGMGHRLTFVRVSRS
jgi:hypothetical protein